MFRSRRPSAIVLFLTYSVQAVAAIGGAFASLLIADAVVNGDVLRALIASAFLAFTAHAFDATANDRAMMLGRTRRR